MVDISFQSPLANQVRRSIVPCLVLMLLFTGILPEAEARQLNESEIRELLERAEEKRQVAEEAEARNLYRQVLNLDDRNFEALWNLSILLSQEGFRQEDERVMRDYFEEAKSLAERSLELYPDSADSYYAYGVAVGRIADFSGPRERIRLSEEIRTHAEKVLEIDPEHAPGNHLLGVWHTRAANLSRTERWAANLLLGGAPEGASNELAESYLKKAIELSPGNILYRLDLAILLMEIGRDEEAIRILRELLEMEPKEKDDPDRLEQAREMLKDLQ